MRIVNFLIIILLTHNIFAQNNMLDYYPMHIGDERQYFKYAYDFFAEETVAVKGIAYEKIIGDTILNNGELYFIFERDDRPADLLEFRRLDSTNMKVYQYSEGSNCGNNEIDVFNLNYFNDTTWFDCYGEEHYIQNDSLLVNDFNFISPQMKDIIPSWGIYINTLTKGMGLTMLEDGDRGTHDFEYLVYAKINNVIYNVPTNIKTNHKIFLSSFKLNQNYPNPFNPATTISYSIPNRDFVTLKIFDCLGKEVALLENGFKNSGEYSIRFDATNIASGIYFCKLTTSRFSKTNKMVLLR